MLNHKYGFSVMLLLLTSCTGPSQTLNSKVPAPTPAIQPMESADQIPADAAAVTATWIAPPHFFLCDRIIALYLGSDGTVTNALTELCGPRLSGFLR